MDEDLTYNENENKPSQKEVISNKLFDKLNPEMITYVQGPEIHRLSVLKVLVEGENLKRQQMKIPSYNILSDVLYEQLVLRTSIKGTRAEQGVKVVTAVIDEQNQIKNDLGNKINQIIRGT